MGMKGSKGLKGLGGLIGLVIVAVFPATISATDPLEQIYAKRTDLQAAFSADTKRAIPGTAAGFLLDLEDWATQYGWMEHEELAMYGPEKGDGVPVRVDSSEIEASIESVAYVVMDRSTGKILTVKNENKVWPIASLTKLVTADVVLDYEVSMTTVADVRATDDVGGAKLYVNDGDTFSIQDLFYATLVASANNAANALSRTAGLSSSEFLEEMNARADSLGLVNTVFVDPTGIELGNVSTAREMARLASETGGKTGYLEESGWNLVVSLRPMNGDPDTELLIVLFGANSRDASFKDANALADWTWKVYGWQKSEEFVIVSSIYS
ncbi:MAG: hypothetical protein UY76_C0021G0021 [Candidatus Uhrbacteria bacterium GW2011_GWA2_52_8d]|uniref:Peptidase S11 D-alanyl-D-alanine carboxypeptidase A N-terminal domain-containing protein n=1 Tax=Candidatus Uhrbacteria bacterium GW2011_GWA2_52_8d TaxID=1618979 RepID=A0A0G1XP64_9BACT|nr:MAG: hypothetical protein UY76_C0021G0021 [Candidatus Uhrbacteria bacterium GW2011_GWA2_52_8d]